MLCVDVNVLINAYFASSPTHGAVSAWFSDSLHGSEPMAIPFDVITGFLRMATDRRIFEVPARPEEATAFIDHLMRQPRVIVPAESVRRFARMRGLVLELGLSGTDIPDAAIAELAMELNATMVTSDRGFRRFPGLRLLDPANTSA